jgi:hypothetical protein
VADASRKQRWMQVTGVAACSVVSALLGSTAPSAASSIGPHRTSAPPSEAVYRKLCRAVQAKHIRALFRVPVAPIQLGGASDCRFLPRGGNADDGVRMFLRIDDGDQTLWKHIGDRSYGKFRPLSGAGDRGKWGYFSGRLPSVVDARSGTFTCTLIPGGTDTRFTPSTGSPLIAARSFARRLLRLCADVFAAHR